MVLGLARGTWRWREEWVFPGEEEEEEGLIVGFWECCECRC